MLVRKAFGFIRHILKILSAEPKKRFSYVLIHILFLALSFGLLYAIKYLYVGTFQDGNINLIVGILGLILAIAAIIPFILHGLIGQIVCVVMCLIFTFKRDGRIYSLLGFLISIISLAGIFLIIYLFLIK